ncbi:MAG: rhamnulokinase family protein [Candidatus Aminicenantes bacterium]|jgi:rhamnulokinase
MGKTSYLAFDLGAESGRAILGSLKDGRLELEELSRFPNGMVPIRGHLHWNVVSLFSEMKRGLKACFDARKARPESLAVDTWGVDFSLLARDGTLLSLPFAYRDSRNEGAMEEFFELVPRKRVYELTGNQFLQFNSIFQLFALKRDRWPLLDVMCDLLFMPDLFNFFFTGEKKTEFTYATTSQLYNPLKKGWEQELFDALDMPLTLMQEIIPPGTTIDGIDESLCRELGIQSLPVIAVASHDTGSAVAAVPAEGRNWAFISSGTWSCMGIEILSPIVTDKALELNFTNEGGVEGTFRFLKNIMGLWLLQECRRIWAKDHLYSYGELMEAAKTAPALEVIFDPDWPGFLNPFDMTEAIHLFCEKTGQTAPKNKAAFVRCILESLALKYRYVLEQLRVESPHPIDCIHIIGGGAKNRLLCQYAANATGLPVIAGPSEATASGNILFQAKTLGHVLSIEEIREIIRHSFKLQAYQPEEVSIWEDAYERFSDMILTLG